MYRFDDFIPQLQKDIAKYISDYLASFGRTDVICELGWPDYTGKLPLAKAHVAISADDDIAFGSPGFGDVAGDGEGEGVRALLNIDVFTSRGNPDTPSTSGGKTGGEKMAGLIARSMTRDRHLLFRSFEDIEDIEDFSIKYSRNPTMLDDDDIFQVHAELVVKILIE